MRHRIVTSCLLAMLTLLAVGCSNDRSVYSSTVARPTTVHLHDSYSGDELWAKAIPVRHRLELDFDRDGENESMSISGNPATRLHWKLYRDDDDSLVERDTVELSGDDVFVAVEYRPSPEHSPAPPSQPSSTAAPASNHTAVATPTEAAQP